jgi:hypothetical protein
MEGENRSAQHVAEAFMSSLCVPAAPTQLDCILPASFCVVQHEGFVSITAPEGLITKCNDIVKAMPSYKINSTVETIVQPDPKAWTYDDIAAIFLEYVVTIDGEEVLGGASNFGMLKTCSGWKISGIASAQWSSTRGPPSKAKHTEGVLHRIEVFVEHLEQRDWNAIITADCLPGGGITLSRAGGYKTMTWPDLIEQLKELVRQTADVAEQVHDVEINVVGDLALAWTPFTISSQGKIIRKGVNIFTLLKDGDGWVLSGIQDTNRPV